jgi:N-acetylglucosamine-1-phosphodiester alpha-N-acetylglucosaminidase
MYWGYFPPQLADFSLFNQMVGGVGWLVRNGINIVNKMEANEYPGIQDGNFTWFINVRSARTVLGHDKDGRMLIMQIDGKTINNKG